MERLSESQDCKHVERDNIAEDYGPFVEKVTKLPEPGAMGGLGTWRVIRRHQNRPNFLL